MGLRSSAVSSNSRKRFLLLPGAPCTFPERFSPAPSSGSFFFLQIFLHSLQPLRNLVVVRKDQLEVQVGRVAQRINATLGVRHARIVEHADNVRNGINIT